MVIASVMIISDVVFCCLVLKAASLFKYIWPFNEHQVLNGWLRENKFSKIPSSFYLIIAENSHDRKHMLSMKKLIVEMKLMM